LRFRVSGLRFGVQGSGFGIWVLDSSLGFGVWSFRFLNLGFVVSGFRVWGFGF
jgi:hypothetical protein